MADLTWTVIIMFAGSLAWTGFFTRKQALEEIRDLTSAMLFSAGPATLGMWMLVWAYLDGRLSLDGRCGGLRSDTVACGPITEATEIVGLTVCSMLLATILGVGAGCVLFRRKAPAMRVSPPLQSGQKR